MGLHSVKAFRQYVSGLPAVTLVEQWESHVAKVGGKVFALCGHDGDHLVFKVTELSFEGLTAISGVDQAPYFARRAWVSVGKGADLADTDLKAYIAASHRMVASKLTRKARTALGLAGL
jgi:predicted DNA-binding protein (MmcQ/YjbR family)